MSQENLLIPDENSKKYPTLISITQHGFGKSTYLDEYRKTKRGASGVKSFNMTKKTGKPVISLILNGEEENLFVTTKNGVTIRVSLDAVPQLGRSTQGVKIIKLDEGDFVISGSVN